MHSLRVDFKLVNNGERMWKTRGEILSMPTVFHMEREGCCTKWGLGCFICDDSCKDGMRLHAGPPTGLEYGNPELLESTMAYASQPKCGGYFTPTLNLFTRSTAGVDLGSFTPTAKVEGPCIFGGCSELCCNTPFKVSSMKDGEVDTKLLRGDLAMITKTKPKGPCAFGRELFTDSDTFGVEYAPDVGLTPQQKAAMMGAMVLTDYMFFEQDHGMVNCEGGKIKITLFECYVCGCVCPFVLQSDQKQGGGGGPPVATEMER